MIVCSAVISTAPPFGRFSVASSARDGSLRQRRCRLKAGRVPRSPTTYSAIGSRFYRRSAASASEPSSFLKATADYADDPDRFWGAHASRVLAKAARFQVSSIDATLVEFVANKARQALDYFMDMGNGGAVRIATRRLRPKAVPDFPVDAVIPSNIPHRERHRLPDDRNSSYSTCTGRPRFGSQSSITGVFVILPMARMKPCGGFITAEKTVDAHARRDLKR